MALIQLDTSTEQLKQYRSLLHSTAICATATGMFIWSITPFLTTNKAARYASLAFSLTMGSTALYCSLKLEQTKALYEAIKKAEKSDFLTRLAASEYSQQQHWEMLSQSFPVATTETTQLQEVEENSFQSSNSSNGSNELAINELIERVKLAQTDGMSDSDIVKKVLGYTGHKYKEGKQLLDEIKLIVSSKNEV